ncbi:hypothetical protein Hanom_Chr06g00523481 [Helianthus anomalus]
MCLLCHKSILREGLGDSCGCVYSYFVTRWAFSVDLILKVRADLSSV